VAGAGRWAYRDRVTLTCAWVGEWRFGLRLGEEVLGIEQCPVHSRRVAAAINVLRPVLPAAADFPLAYYVQSGAQLVLVLKCAHLPDDSWFTPGVRDQLQAAGVEGLWLHLFPSVGKKVLAKNHWHLLWGAARSRDADGLWYGPAAFQQLLPTLHRMALDEAEAYLSPHRSDRVIDLYCGTGSTLRRWCEAGAYALGIESSGEALECARLNAPAADLLRGECVTRLPQLRQWAGLCAGRKLLYANPPRTGLEAEVLQWLVTDYRPERVAYLSCSAGTLARDLSALAAQGYAVQRLSPYDFFPQTHHVEVLALLQRADCKK